MRGKVLESLFTLSDSQALASFLFLVVSLFKVLRCLSIMPVHGRTNLDDILSI